MESGDATAPNEPRRDRRNRGPRRDREPPSRQNVGARDERHDSEEQAEAEQSCGGRQEARHGFQDDQGERVGERSHGEDGRALTRFEPPVQLRGRERRLQAPHDIDRNLEEDRARKHAGTVHAKERRGGHDHHEADRPEFAEDTGDPAREGGPDRRDDEETRDRYRDLSVGKAEETKVQRPVEGHHVQGDAEEHLEADQKGDPLTASNDPEALAQLLRVRRFREAGDHWFDEREGHQDRDQIQGGAGEQGEPQVVERFDEETSAEGARGVRQELNHRVPADVPGELGFVLRRQQGLVEVRGGPDRERGPEGPDHVRDDEPREGRGQTVSEDSGGAKHLAQEDRPLASGPIRDHADGKLEDEEPDPERDVDEGELEVGAQVPADPEGPERDPDGEGRRRLVQVEPADLRDDLGRQHAFAATETRWNIRFVRTHDSGFQRPWKQEWKEARARGHNAYLAGAGLPSGGRWRSSSSRWPRPARSLGRGTPRTCR